MYNYHTLLSKFLKKIYENTFFILISTLIFVTVGENLTDYKRILFLKILLIIYMLPQLNFLFTIKSIKETYRNVAILVSLFLLCVTVSYILTPYDVADFAFNWGRIRYLHIVSDILLFVTLFFYLKKVGINYGKFISSIILPGIFFSIFLLSSIIIDKEIQHSSDQLIFFDGIRQAGMLFSFLICFIAGYIFCNNKTKFKYIYYFFITLLFTLIFLFEGRGSFVSIIFTFLFIFAVFFIIKKNFRNEFFSLIIVLSVSFVLAQLIFNLIDNTFMQLEIKKHRQFFGYTYRLELWEYAIGKYQQNPFFGSGPGSFFMITYSDWVLGKSPYNTPHTQPHNMILQFLIEWGLFGTSIILVLLTKIFISSLIILIKFKKLIFIIPGIGLILLSAHGMIDGTFFHPTFTFLIVLLLSVLCNEIEKIDRL